MSAIAGIFNRNKEPVAIDHGKDLMAALRKYPADAVRTWQKDNIFFGCHAQWITPESVNEQLPYYDEKRRLAITADAIIDNREELFEQLRVERKAGNMMPDSELILRAYQKWGEEVPKHLIGDFAFMIWDEGRNRLFGARDFSGGRTLYYFQSPQQFAFCTAIKPLFSLPYVEQKLNEQWLAEFLALVGMLDAADIFSTVYKNIAQLPPSHSISVSADRAEISRYCTITPGEQLRLKSDQEYVEAFRAVFQSAVTARLRARDNVGARLSGGLDSGSVVGFAAKALEKANKRLYTFSYVPTKDFVDWTPKTRIADESDYIQATVQHVGNIQDCYLDFPGRSPLSEIDELLDTLEIPYKFFGNSFWLKGIYEQARHNRVGILLNGGRGNYTVSWGPALDYYIVLLKRLKWYKLYRELQMYGRNLKVKPSRIFTTLRKRAFPQLGWNSAKKENYEHPLLINPEFAKRTGVFERLQGYGVDLAGNPTAGPNMYEARIQRLQELCYWNIPGTSGSKLSLRYSLWERDPTNDLRVIRFCLSVPEEQFVQNGFDRALIRRATEGYLPDQVRLNQRIRGIQGADMVHRMIPAWSQFIQELQRVCRDNAVCEYVNMDTVSAAIAKVGVEPKPEYAIDSDFRVLMRCLIIYRFLKKLERG